MKGNLMKFQNVEDKEKILKLYREEIRDLAIQSMEHQSLFNGNSRC